MLPLPQQICENCRFCVEVVLGDTRVGERDGLENECRRRPPARDKDGEGVWPRVQAADWCGHWRPSPAAVKKMKGGAHKPTGSGT